MCEAKTQPEPDDVKPLIRVLVEKGKIVIVGNARAFQVLNESLTALTIDGYAERFIGPGGEPTIVCSVLCEDHEVDQVQAGDPRAEAAIGELFSYYTTDDPTPPEKRFGLSRNGLEI